MAKTIRSRHDNNHLIEKPLREDDQLLFDVLDVLDPTDRFDILPRNWLEQFAPISRRTGKRYHPEYFRHYVSELTCPRPNQASPLLGRFLFNSDEGVRNNGEMMKYFRTDAGDAYMAAQGKPRLAYHRARVQDKHQLFGNLCRASLELGVREDPNMYLHGPRHILNHPKMGAYDAKAPFTFQLPDRRRYSPDGKPLIIGRLDTRESKLLICEHDRGTEGTSPASDPNEQTRLDEKFEKIVLAWKLGLPQQKYGHRAALLLFETISEGRARNVAAYLEARFGKLPFVLIKGYPEFAKLYRTIPVTTKAYDEPWLRPGCKPFSLMTLGEVN